MLTFQFQLYPSKSQQEKLWLHANKCNELYNYFLNQKIEAYKNNIKIEKFDQSKELPKLKIKDPSLKEIFGQTLQEIPLRLEKAYKAFFKKTRGFPNFRSCKKFYSLCFPQPRKFNIQNNFFHTTQYGKIKFNKYREILGKIKQISIIIKKEKWYLNIITDYNQIKNKNNKIIGIDLGITSLVATSDNEIIKNTNHAKYFDKQIIRL